MLTVNVDYSDLLRLPGVIESALRAGLDRSTEQTAEAARKLVPRRRGILARGVHPKKSFPTAQVEIQAIARAPRVGQYQARNGRIKVISFRQRAPHDYAPDVDQGTRGPIVPKQAKALLIEVPSRPVGEGFVVAEGRFYILRRSARGQKAQNFSGRAATQTAPLLPAIFVQEIDRR